jgi:hypothetical protein
MLYAFSIITSGFNGAPPLEAPRLLADRAGTLAPVTIRKVDHAVLEKTADDLD